MGGKQYTLHKKRELRQIEDKDWPIEWAIGKQVTHRLEIQTTK